MKRVDDVKDCSNEKSPTSSISTEKKIRRTFLENMEIVKTREQVIEWVPSVGRDARKKQAPSVLDISVKAVSENLEHCDSLEGIPDPLCSRIISEACNLQTMNCKHLQLMLEGYRKEIRIKDCSWLTELQFHEAFQKYPKENLRVLQLGKSHLTDSAVKEFVNSARSLLSLNLSGSTGITSRGIESIAECLGVNLKELFIDNCHNIDSTKLFDVFERFRSLEVLSIAYIPSINDNFIEHLISVCGRTLKELNLAGCKSLTDQSMKAVGSRCGDLISLDVSHLKLLTDSSLEYLANGCQSIQKIKLNNDSFSDEAIAAFIECAGEALVSLSLNHVTNAGPLTAFSLAKCAKKMVKLDITFCRNITVEALGMIVDTCASLELLVMFMCRQIPLNFEFQYSDTSLRIVRRIVHPYLEDCNLFDGHEGSGLRYSPLPN